VLNRFVHEGIEVERRNGFRMGIGWNVSLDYNFLSISSGEWSSG